MRRGPGLIVLAGALLQAGLFVADAPRTWADTARLGRLFTDAEPPPFAAAWIAVRAARSLPPLAARIPVGQRVLLVTDCPIAAQYDYFFQPRPLRVLLPVDLEQAARFAAVSPDQAHQVEVWRRAVLRNECALTPQALAEGLAWADWVVWFSDGPPALPAGPGVVRVAEHEDAVLWRVVRDGAP